MPDDVSALQLLLAGDPALLAIVRLSLIVSLSAVVFGGFIGVPFGAAIALIRFPGREAVIVILNALMGLPPVVVGLAIYLLLSRSGPLGSWGLLFTPQAMVVAQTVLIVPIIAALTRQTVEDLWSEYREELAAMDVGPLGRIATLIWDGQVAIFLERDGDRGRSPDRGAGALRHHHRGGALLRRALDGDRALRRRQALRLVRRHRVDGRAHLRRRRRRSLHHRMLRLFRQIARPHHLGRTQAAAA